jgi:hypothetical protein
LIYVQEIPNGAKQLSDGQGLRIAVRNGSSLERIWNNRESIFGQMNLDGWNDRDYLAVLIHMSQCVGWFEHFRYLNRDPITRGKRRDSLNKLSAALHATISGLRNLDEESRFEIETSIGWEETCEDDDPEPLNDVANKLTILREEVLSWSDECSDIKVGNSKDETLHDLLKSLVGVFETCTEKKAAKPHMRASKKMSHKEDIYDGPFYRFCCAVLAEIDKSEVPKLPYAITAIMKTRLK